jgi:RNA polymerase sigma factor (sigma-70 family)
VTEAELDALYDAYAYAVHRRCARLLGSNADADDALQEVFIAVMRYGDSLRNNESPIPWLYRIADRHCFRILTKRKRWVLDEDAIEAQQTGTIEEARLVREVLGSCKESVRDVAVLYYVDQMTQDEVAAEIGLSRKTVRQRLSEFLATARALLHTRKKEVS